MANSTYSRYLMFGIITFVVVFENCAARKVLDCYKCSVTVEKYLAGNKTIVTQICSKFEESNEYVVRCPFSTMCLKTISVLHLQNGHKQETVTRGCAQQKNITQIFRNKQWEQEHLVQEIYNEGCTEIKDNILVGSTNIHCYCRGQLCNSSYLLKPTIKIVLALVFLIFFW